MPRLQLVVGLGGMWHYGQHLTPFYHFLQVYDDDIEQIRRQVSDTLWVELARALAAVFCHPRYMYHLKHTRVH